MNNEAASVPEYVRRCVRSIVPRAIYGGLAGALDGLTIVMKAGTENYRRLRLAGVPGATGTVTLSLPMLEYPLTMRAGTSDAGELTYTVIREAYGQVPPPAPTRFIVDAGANIGDSTAWYLSKYPDARVVALEPDRENFELLERNCSPYGSRAILLEAGLWPRDAQLAVSSSGDKNAVTVAEVPAGTAGSCPGRSVLSILAQAGESQIDIFKCDIEGAETRLFSEESDPWLERTRSIYIELHGSEAERAVFEATRRHGFKHVGYRNLHVFRR